MTATQNARYVETAPQVRDRLAEAVNQVMALADEVVAIAGEAPGPQHVDEMVHALRAGPDTDAGLMWARLYLAGHRGPAEVARVLADMLRVRSFEASRRGG